MLTLIVGGEVYTPEPLGVRWVLLAGERIASIGDAGAEVPRPAGLPLEVVEAHGCSVVPGFVDVHEHLIGAGGEQGFASRQPAVAPAEMALAGITTVVGCLGTDGITRSLEALLGRVRQLEAWGFSAFMYTGGFWLPPQTLTGSVQRDLVLIDRVVGVGELAIADSRSSQPRPDELARLAAEAYVGGTLSDKGGVLHLHVGPGRERLAPVRMLLDEYEVRPEQLYPTHVNRSEALLEEAIALTRRGCYVDLDTVEGDAPHWVRAYRERGGPPERLTLSSDAHTPGARPGKLFEAFAACLRELRLSPNEVLPWFTSNPARALRLASKGRLTRGAAADVVIIRQDDLRVEQVFVRGRPLVRGGTYLDPTDNEQETTG